MVYLVDFGPCGFWGVVWVVLEVEDVWGVVPGESELDWFVVGGVGVVPGFYSGCDLVVSFGVGGVEEVCSVSYEDVPDDDCVFDCCVFLVVESAVEDVEFGGA